MLCDLCGSSKVGFVCAIEGSEVTVCGPCSKYGQVIRSLDDQPVKVTTRMPEAERVEGLVSNFASLIRKKREASGMTQEDFAKMIGEKLSILHKLEAGQIAPDLDTAKKLERKLGLKLVVREEEAEVSTVKHPSAALTIGDVLNLA